MTSTPTRVNPGARASSIVFPFPLREHLDVSLTLPRDLTKAEAERLAGFIRSLAVDAGKPTLRIEPPTARELLDGPILTHREQGEAS